MCRREASGPPAHGRVLAVVFGGMVVAAGAAVLVARLAARPTSAPRPDPGGAAPGLASAPRAAPPQPRMARPWGSLQARPHPGAVSGVRYPDPHCDVAYLFADPVPELQEMRRRCEANDAEACTHLGFACNASARGKYPRGLLPSTPLSDDACAALRSGPAMSACGTGGGAAWFYRGCYGGDLLACWQPVEAFEAGRKKYYTEPELREKAGQACEHGMATACFDFARPPLFTSAAVSLAYRRIGDELYACMVDGGTGCTPSAGARDAVASALSQAATAAQEAASAAVVDRQRRCDANVAQACAELAGQYLEAPSKDSVRAAALARRACDLGSAGGCFTLSSLYGSGDGLPRDEARALALNARAEELAGADACGAGGSLEGCIGIIKGLNASNAERSTALAPDTARAACEQGDPMMCLDLARLYFTDGPTVAKDPAKVAEYQGAAMRLWKDACGRGVGSACRTIALSLARPGPGEAPDFDRAAVYAKRGCNDDHDAFSCVMLAGMYERGEGVAKDAARGKRCFEDNERAREVDAEAPGCP